MCGLIATVLIAVALSSNGADEIIALFTFSDMVSLNDGTSLATKEMSVGLASTLTMTEAGGALADKNGQTGVAGFIDVEGVSNSDTVCASWTTGLVGAENAGQNYFILETSTTGFSDLTLRFDTYSTSHASGTGPSELTLEYAVDDGDYQSLDSLSLTVDSNWHAYTNKLDVTEMEQAAQVRIRGTWSADATFGSGRMDNLQLTGSFTNGLSRVALYTFTGSNRLDSAGFDDISAGALGGVGISGYLYLGSSPNTRSGSPNVSFTPQSGDFHSGYYRFDVSPENTVAFTPSLLRCTARGGVSTGIVEAAMIINDREFSLGTNTVNLTDRPLIFRVPDLAAVPLSATIEYRLYTWVDNSSSFRFDDLEVIGTVGDVAVNDVVVLYPFTGSVLTDTAGDDHVSATSITSSGTGDIAIYTNPDNFNGSESGVPAMMVNGLNGSAEDRYVSFDLTTRWDTILTPTLIRLFARTGSGTGTIRAEWIAAGITNSLGSYDIDNVVREYVFTVPNGWIPPLAGTAQVRLYGWGLSSSASTLRIDDWQIEGVIVELPATGTVILVN